MGVLASRQTSHHGKAMNFIVAGAASALICTATGCSAPRDTKPSISYALETRNATDDVVLTCKASSSGKCAYWVGMPGSATPTAMAAMPVGERGITKIAHGSVYCVGVDAEHPPAWPSCSNSLPGGLFYQSTSVDYRWQ